MSFRGVLLVRDDLRMKGEPWVTDYGASLSHFDRPTMERQAAWMKICVASSARDLRGIVGCDNSRVPVVNGAVGYKGSSWWYDQANSTWL